MKRTLYLHIGLLKTATTTIQRELIDHREMLLEQCNYLFPYQDHYYDFTNGAFRFAGLRRDNQDIAEPKPILQEVFDAIAASDVPNIILSDEKFSLMRDEHVQHLRTFCEGYDTKIIVYVRRQDSYLQALWAQWTKMGLNTRDFQTWLQTELDTADSIHYDRIMNRWGTHFGHENIIVRPFERGKLHTNIIVDFLQACGIDNIDWVPEPANYNTSPGLQTIETIRYLLQHQAQLLPQIESTPSMQMRLAYQVREYAKMNNWDSATFNLIDTDTYHTIMACVSEGNQQVAQQYLKAEYLFSDDVPQKPVDHVAQPITVDESLLRYLRLMRQRDNSYIKQLLSRVPLLKSILKKMLARRIT